MLGQHLDTDPARVDASACVPTWTSTTPSLLRRVLIPISRLGDRSRASIAAFRTRLDPRQLDLDLVDKDLGEIILQ